MIWQTSLLNPEVVEKFTTYYKDELFESGNRSNPDQNVKQSLQMIAGPVNTSLVNIFWNEMNNHTTFGSIFLIKKTSQAYFNWYKEGHFYDWHLDSYPVGGVNADMSVSILLSDPDEYEGGELVIKVGNTETSHKPKAGTAIVYNTGMWHKVNPVTKGNRKVICIWYESIIHNSFVRNHMIDWGETMWGASEDQIDHKLKSRLEQHRLNIIREYGRPI